MPLIFGAALFEGVRVRVCICVYVFSRGVSCCGGLVGVAVNNCDA